MAFLNNITPRHFSDAEINSGPDFDKVLNEGDNKTVDIMKELSEVFQKQHILNEQEREASRKTEVQINKPVVTRQETMLSQWKQKDDLPSTISLKSSLNSDKISEALDEDSDFARSETDIISEPTSTEYFLMLNQKTKDIAKKRKRMKQMGDDNELSLHD